jgi:D-3-phosphoglycerate dehydrogenase
MSLAKERAIKIKESKSSKEEEFINLISLEIKTDKETKIISGTLSANKKPRVVKIDAYYVEISPDGNMIIIQNEDKPGIIGNLGTLLGKHNINIAAMTFGREREGGRAISVLNVDSVISSEVADQIKKIENILSVKLICI